jgi:hypothetical protein
VADFDKNLSVLVSIGEGKRYFSQSHFNIDKTVAFGIVDSTILINFLFPKGVVDGERPLKFLLRLLASKIYLRIAT